MDHHVEGLYPTWIGSPQYSTAPSMTCTVRLQYSQEGLNAPVYVVTSMSDPQWAPLEMDQENNADGTLVFFKDFEATPGKHQYKYRLGPGDWWALDETKPSVHDDAGNRNNLVVVEPRPTPSAVAEVQPDLHSNPELETPDSEFEAPLLKHESLIVDDPSISVDTTLPARVHVPMFRHENLQAKNAPSVFDSDASSDEEFDAPEAPVLRHETTLPNKPLTNFDSAYHSQDGDDHAPPLFSHESFISSDLDSEDEVSSTTAHDDFLPPVTFDSDSQHDPDAPTSGHAAAHDLEDTPLFRHESMFIDSTCVYSDVSTDYSFDHDKEHASLHDSGVQVDQFPVERTEIMRHLVRVSSRLSEDEIDFKSTPPSSPIAPYDQFRRRSSSLRTSITLESFSQLEPIKEAEEPRSAAQQSPHKSANSITSPTDILTPPMTPDMGADESIDMTAASLGPKAVADQITAASTVEADSSKELNSNPSSATVPVSMFNRVQGIFGSAKKRVANFNGRTILAVMVGLAAAIAYKWQSIRVAVATRTLRVAYPHAHSIDVQHRAAA